MRIIGGQAHGRRLRAPHGHATRPPLARIRSSIFSRLEARTEVAGRRVLDLFAGSGSLGIEALSRGAASATFVESARPACAALSANLEELAMTENTRLLCMPVDKALRSLAAAGERFDLIFIDPPYRSGLGFTVFETLLTNSTMAAGAWAVLHIWNREQAPQPLGLEQVSVATISDHQIAIYRRNEE